MQVRKYYCCKKRNEDKFISFSFYIFEKKNKTCSQKYADKPRGLEIKEVKIDIIVNNFKKVRKVPIQKALTPEGMQIITRVKILLKNQKKCC